MHNHTVCWSTLVTAKQRQYYYIKDGQRRRYFRAAPIEATVVEHVRARVATLPSDDRVLIHKLRAAMTAMRHAAQEHLDVVCQQRQRVLRLAVEGRFTDHEIAGELSRLDGDLARAEREVSEVAMVESLHTNLIAEVCACIAAMRTWDELTKEAQCATLTAFVDHVEIDDQGQVTRVVWAALWEYLA